MEKAIESGQKKDGGKVFVFRFDPEDVDLYERATVHADGYAHTRVGGRLMLVHRLIAERMGLGDGPVDHVNGVRQDNRRENLRSATRSLNARNRSYKGYVERHGRFQSKHVYVNKPFREISPVVPINALAIDLKELKAEWPGCRVYIDRNKRLGHRLYVRPMAQKTFDTKEEAVLYYEACRVHAFGSHEGRRRE